MSGIAAGSWPWLLRHEIRLAWRQVSGRRSRWWSLLMLLVFWALIHLGAWAMLSGALAIEQLPAVRVALGAAGWLVATLMLSQAILLSVSAVFDRGDLDLLLSSPLPSRQVFVVRGLGIAASYMGLYLLLLGPFAHVGAFTGHPGWLALYPAIAALALLATGLGLLLTLSLVRWLGARRARGVAQVMGAFTGALLVLGSQGQNLLPAAQRGAMQRALREWTGADGPLGPESLAWVPSRAAMGEPLPLLFLAVAGVGVFWAVVMLAHHRFVAGTQEPVTGDAVKRARRKAGPLNFRPGVWRNVLVKEWKLIARDPQLLSQTLLQVLYMLPLVFLASRRQDMLGPTMAGAIVLAGTLSATLAWITVAAEDAPELVGMAPVPIGRIRWMKVVAAIVPVWLLVSPLVAYLLLKAPAMALVFVGCLAGCSVSAGMAQVWYPRRGDRRNMSQRAKSGAAMNILEFIGGMGWAGIAWCLVEFPLGAVAVLPFALLPLAAAWVLGRAKRREGALV